MYHNSCFKPPPETENRPPAQVSFLSPEHENNSIDCFQTVPTPKVIYFEQAGKFSMLSVEPFCYIESLKL